MQGQIVNIRRKHRTDDEEKNTTKHCVRHVQKVAHHFILNQFEERKSEFCRQNCVDCVQT